MVRLQRLNSQNYFLTDFVLTVYTVINSKTNPILPKMGIALAREQSLSGIRPSDINSWAGSILTIQSANIARTIFPDCYFNRCHYFLLSRRVFLQHWGADAASLQVMPLQYLPKRSLRRINAPQTFSLKACFAPQSVRKSSGPFLVAQEQNRNRQPERSEPFLTKQKKRNRTVGTVFQTPNLELEPSLSVKLTVLKHRKSSSPKELLEPKTGTACPETANVTEPNRATLH